MERHEFENLFCMDCKKQRVCEVDVWGIPRYLEIRNCTEFDKIDEVKYG